ncbi:hypothetical protein RIF29_31102 [Crotalaria pallida]|uniref:Uncharacterized protein n=1 Tax=Crotalaria pallida TaxID=3830 RepID=A0AAN9EHC8_CROPI
MHASGLLRKSSYEEGKIIKSDGKGSRWKLTYSAFHSKTILSPKPQKPSSYLSRGQPTPPSFPLPSPNHSQRPLISPCHNCG